MEPKSMEKRDTDLRFLKSPVYNTYTSAKATAPIEITFGNAPSAMLIVFQSPIAAPKIKNIYKPINSFEFFEINLSIFRSQHIFSINALFRLLINQHIILHQQAFIVKYLRAFTNFTGKFISKSEHFTVHGTA